VPVWDILDAPAGWVAKMIRYLPYHQDRFFTLLTSAVWGEYKLQFKSGQTDETTVKADAARDLDRFGRAADGAMKQYQLKKAMRGNRIH
jgi:hypothetical protein